MSKTKEELKQEIRDNINTNGKQSITGQILQGVLVDMVDNIPDAPEESPFIPGEGSGSAILSGSEATAIGQFAVAEGYGTNASGNYSHVEGRSTQAKGNYSHAEGSNTQVTGTQAHVEGDYSIATGDASHAEGWSTQTTNPGEHAEGKFNKSNKNNGANFGTISSIGIGENAQTRKNAFEVMQNGDAYLIGVGGYDGTNPSTSSSIQNQFVWEKGSNDDSIQQKNTSASASGTGSCAMGSNTKASGIYSHAEGYETTASGQYSHAENGYTAASNGYTHAEGNNTKASGRASHAEGHSTTASGQYSHAEGDGNKSQGNCSHVEGLNSLASGTASHAEGCETKSTGSCSHAEGYGTNAYGETSHAEGNQTIASGSYSHAEGYMTSIPQSAISSHAEGYMTQVTNLAEHAEGRWNKSNTVVPADPSAPTPTEMSKATLHSVGIGYPTDPTDPTTTIRANAFEIMQNGDIYVIGLGGYDGTNAGTTGVQTLQQLLGGGIVLNQTDTVVSEDVYTMLSLIDEVPLSINVLIKREGSNYTQINPVIDIIKYSDNILIRFIRTDVSDCKINFWKIYDGTAQNPYNISKSTKTIQYVS